MIGLISYIALVPIAIALEEFFHIVACIQDKPNCLIELGIIGVPRRMVPFYYKTIFTVKFRGNFSPSSIVGISGAGPICVLLIGLSIFGVLCLGLRANFAENFILTCPFILLPLTSLIPKNSRVTGSNDAYNILKMYKYFRLQQKRYIMAMTFSLLHSVLSVLSYIVKKSFKDTIRPRV